jgi:hypothetical protein
MSNVLMCMVQNNLFQNYLKDTLFVMKLNSRETYC